MVRTLGRSISSCGTCTTNEDCTRRNGRISGVCDDDKQCVQCIVDGDCDDAGFCFLSHCHSRGLSANARCLADSWCSSGSCSGGVCTAP